MAINSISIQNLSDAYGWLASYKGLPFPVNISGSLELIRKNTGSGSSGAFSPVPGYAQGQDSEYDAGSVRFNDLHGRPVICPAVIGGVKLGSGEDFTAHLALQPMVVIEGGRRIVKTPVGGGRYSGTVKEFINFDDYRVRIHGFLVNRNQRAYPVDQLRVLQELWLRHEAVEFQCIITDSLFSHVVIENLILDELNMAPGMQRYEISAVSDGILEVEQLVMEKNSADTEG